MREIERRVLLVTPSIDMGGMQRAMSILANGLCELGYKVEMYSLFRNSHFYKLDERVKYSEPKVKPVNQNPVSRFFSILKDVRRTAKRSQAEVIVSYGRYYSSLVMLATLGLGKRVYISDRASPDYRDPLFANTVTTLICKFIKPTGIIAQTGISAEFQRKRFGESVSIKIIPNAVNQFRAIDIRKENVVLAVGRFGDYLKGFDRLIEAWGKVDRNGWRLMFAGGSEGEAPELAERARVLGVYDSIDFLGKVDDMSSCYARSKIFVIPSRSEGFPNALAEAMCAGLCCIAFDFKAGPRDIIANHVNGIIVPDGDIDALASAISNMIADHVSREQFAAKAIELRKSLTKEKVCSDVADFIFKS